jgi:hypothetical protein
MPKNVSGHLAINGRSYKLAAARLHFLLDDHTWTFETKSVGTAPREQLEASVEMNGFLPLAKQLPVGKTHVVKYGATHNDNLQYYMHDHLIFERARVAVTSLGKTRYALAIDGKVRDPRGEVGAKMLAIAVRAEIGIEGVSVSSQNVADGRRLLAAAGFVAEAKTFTWSPTGFDSPIAAQSKAALAKLVEKLKRVKRPKTTVEKEQYRAIRDIRAQLRKRFPAEAKALLTSDAAELDAKVGHLVWTGHVY